MALVFLLLTAFSAVWAQEPHRCAACHVEAVAGFKTHKHAASNTDYGRRGSEIDRTIVRRMTSWR